MYEEIRKENQKPKGNLKLWLWVAGCVLIAAVVILPLINFVSYYPAFYGFIEDFSSATHESYNGSGVLLVRGEEEFYLSRDNIYNVYTRISDAGPGRLGESPETESDAVLHYSSGEKLELWRVKLDDYYAQREYGLFICFTNLEGETYSYDTDALELGVFPFEGWQNGYKTLNG